MATRKFTKSERYVLQALANKPGATSQEVQEACDIHLTYALRLLKRMTVDGLVTPIMVTPTYELTARGRSALDSLTKP